MWHISISDQLFTKYMFYNSLEVHNFPMISTTEHATLQHFLKFTIKLHLIQV